MTKNQIKFLFGRIPKHGELVAHDTSGGKAEVRCYHRRDGIVFRIPGIECNYTIDEITEYCEIVK